MDLESELTGVRSGLEAELASAKADLATARGDGLALEEALAQARAEVVRLSGELDRAEQRIAKLLSEVKDKRLLEGSVAEMQAALAELDRRKRRAEERVAAFRDLLGRFQKLIDAGKLQVKIVDGRMVVQLATDVLFASGSATLSAEGAEAVVEVSQVLSDIPDRRYQVEGHTDDVPIHTTRFPSNWELASARATTVVKTMIEAGLAPERISAASFGEFQPVVPNDTVDHKASNRRIEIVVVPDLSGLPGFEELQAL